ncbi:hypothetical protein A3A71_04300 [Candidatus Berkelbacteria bacterium RIFCSPLOWO2_01_FULL_50_28]|uniref:Ion transport domain-containing protein n=1 Tax=Candidatus Berkelbacteria bacterium RIFCSPLOWO2_01_FULL_50_28 TaxID=1797471 RepID=A0A1F5EAG7_9BACT|nr:MAG: hypothetical protein A2807_03310 [Candidatus Berkelbacteria bacterium RIFCSPHIGHO2_01_FULL_50_36]OGD62427.1 MAG: hypothetical protein A3F39_01845 [Candidatus Berkelbacteria bacterium RIFCSPHIGHO2_12_FULL_50_11]OGD64353.1 MAG: hypothetical protein A3A71_04300 [Candidatus Berkelbacteria bacterium RIFCSPLOWO2_01_FULL_50_28]
MKRSEILVDIGLVVLAIISTGLLVFEITHDVTASTSKLISQLDIVIALIFFADFIYGFLQAKSKSQFFSKRWYELLASIPITSTTTQILRSLRLLRVLRIIRLMARMRRVADFYLDGPKFQILSIVLTVFTLVFMGAVAFHSYEFGINQNVHNLFDSFWWAMVTVTTIGYGDIYPVTTAGRIVAMMLMIVGIGTLGTVIGSVATQFLRAEEEFKKE